MSNPVYCGRTGCEHRLRVHHQGGGPVGRCLTTGCECSRFIEPSEVNALARELTRHKELSMNPWQHRHPSVAHFSPMFAFDHLPVHLQAVSRPFAELAIRLLGILSDGRELAMALRKLVEAKDCAVRQAVADRG